MSIRPHTSLLMTEHEHVMSELSDNHAAFLNAEIKQLKANNSELLEALITLQNAAYNIGGEHVTDHVQLIESADKAGEVIAKAKGESQ